MTKTRDLNRPAYLAVTVLLLTGCTAPQTTAPLDGLASITANLPAMMERASIPGLALAIVEGDEIQERVFGVADVGVGTAATEETVFEAASLSKPVFAYAVLRLAQRGVLDLDRPLNELSDFAGTDFAEIQQDPRMDKITPRLVLTHTTGFPNWSRDAPLAFLAEPGESFGYSGEGFVYLQTAVEAVTGKPVEEVLQEEVLGPLGMRRSSFVWRQDYDSLSAVGHDFLAEPQEKQRPEEPNVAGSLHTTAGDFALFLREMLRPTLLPEETVAAMLTAGSKAADGVHWGLGWGLEQAGMPADDSGGREETFFWHWGNNGVFRCFTMGSRASGRAMAFFTNSENGLAVAEALVARFAAGEHPALVWRDFQPWDSPALEIQKKLVLAGTEGGAPAIRSTYEAIRAELPDNAFQEAALNGLGYQLLRRQANDAAVEIFTVNTELFPESWNVWDSLGESLMGNGEVDQAIRAYERSLQLNPENGNGRQMLAKLMAIRDRPGVED